ncbi:phosphatidylserine decarboxylase proenzyme, mitochondrial isoform X3 [Balaenoptera ricei]|uniref:phosphatidylserine decarboxylase proenzyme, mitochondrial isoform X3 n=1 Tax=Balaenoptera ricei TaxID=2746895 RepID=UPI0028BE3BAD|nr:phosphatidylserine decarboxylase proenzyme, mitochondrial isoform X3 [Balaenoptera ricei]
MCLEVALCSVQRSRPSGEVRSTWRPWRPGGVCGRSSRPREPSTAPRRHPRSPVAVGPVACSRRSLAPPLPLKEPRAGGRGAADERAWCPVSCCRPGGLTGWSRAPARPPAVRLPRSGTSLRVQPARGAEASGADNLPRLGVLAGSRAAADQSADPPQRDGKAGRPVSLRSPWCPSSEAAALIRWTGPSQGAVPQPQPLGRGAVTAQELQGGREEGGETKGASLVLPPCAAHHVSVRGAARTGAPRGKMVRCCGPRLHPNLASPRLDLQKVVLPPAGPEAKAGTAELHVQTRPETALLAPDGPLLPPAPWRPQATQPGGMETREQGGPVQVGADALAVAGLGPPQPSGAAALVAQARLQPVHLDFRG